jgi:hypothetical protein
LGTANDPLNDAEDGEDGDATFSGGFLFGKDDDAAAGERQELEREELLARASSLMQAFEGCEKLRVIDVTRLDKPDQAGCNWSMSIVLDAAGVAPELYVLAYGEAIVMARERWNLK